MGQVVPFIARVRDSGDWSATERARLQELADRLSANGVDVEVIFGATDEGDPWCVVTDGSGDVLIHVARIDGLFVVHSAVDDAVNENTDLHAALRDRLAATEEAVAPQTATILPFGMTARQGQTFLALVVAASFFYETTGIAGTAEAAELPSELPPADTAPAGLDTDSTTQEREVAAQGATTAHQPAGAAPALTLAALTLPEPPPAAAPAATADPAEPTTPATGVETPSETAGSKADDMVVLQAELPATVIQGTDADDLLIGTAADEHIIGGDGDDTLRGGGGNDLLEGGAGDDVIELRTGVIAVGGSGADTFVIQAPTQLGHGETLLGVVLDFRSFEGDRLTASNGRIINVAERPAPAETGRTDIVITGGGDANKGVDPLEPPTLGPPTLVPPTLTPPTLGPPPGDDFGTLVTPPLTRVDVDLDGDGVADGYVLLGIGGAAAGVSAMLQVGRGLNSTDLLG